MATEKTQSEPKLPNILFYTSAPVQRLTFVAAMRGIALEIQRQNPEELWQECFRKKAASLTDEAVTDLESLGAPKCDANEYRERLPGIILEIFNQA